MEINFSKIYEFIESGHLEPSKHHQQFAVPRYIPTSLLPLKYVYNEIFNLWWKKGVRFNTAWYLRQVKFPTEEQKKMLIEDSESVDDSQMVSLFDKLEPYTSQFFNSNPDEQVKWVIMIVPCIAILVLSILIFCLKRILRCLFGKKVQIEEKGKKNV